MKLKLAMAGLLLAGSVLPAMADTTYYVVQDSSTHHCRIVSQKPVTKEVTVVGEDGYTSETQAQTAMKSVKVCHDE